MAALVTANLGQWQKSYGVVFAGPTKVADASETDLSTPDTSLSFDVKGVHTISAKLKFANYTSVTLKWQESFDAGVTYQDVTNATTSTTATTVSLSKALISSTEKLGLLRAPLVRLSIAGTLSGGADTLDVWVYAEREPV